MAVNPLLAKLTLPPKNNCQLGAQGFDTKLVLLRNDSEISISQKLRISHAIP